MGQTSCVYRSNTFFGSFQVTGEGPGAIVRLRYNGEEIEAPLGVRAAESLAEALLEQLVMREALAMNVMAENELLTVASLAGTG